MLYPLHERDADVVDFGAFEDRIGSLPASERPLRTEVVLARLSGQVPRLKSERERTHKVAKRCTLFSCLPRVMKQVA